MCGGHVFKLATWTSNYLLINISESRNCIFMSAEIMAKNVQNILGHTVQILLIHLGIFLNNLKIFKICLI